MSKSDRDAITVPLAWLDSAQAAEYVKLHRETLARLRRDGRGPRCRTAGAKKILYHITDLDRWVRDGEEVDR